MIFTLIFITSTYTLGISKSFRNMFKKDDDQVYLRGKESKSSTKSPHVKRKYVDNIIIPLHLYLISLYDPYVS